MVSEEKLLIYPPFGTGESHFISSCLFSSTFILFNLSVTKALLKRHPSTVFILCIVPFVLQEESRERPGEQGPRSKFGPSTEDLAGAPKQVDDANVS